MNIMKADQGMAVMYILTLIGCPCFAAWLGYYAAKMIKNVVSAMLIRVYGDFI